MLTLRDLVDKLEQIDEVSLLEILNITSEDIVERFLDFIEDNYERLITEFEDQESDS